MQDPSGIQIPSLRTDCGHRDPTQHLREGCQPVTFERERRKHHDPPNIVRLARGHNGADRISHYCAFRSSERLITASAPAMALVTSAALVAWPVMILRFECLVLTLSGDRTRAVTLWPAATALFDKKQCASSAGSAKHE